MAVTLQQVEELRAIAKVSYADAKAALEASGGDLLDAMILLERQGKVGDSGVEGYNTVPGPETPEQDGEEPDAARPGRSLTGWVKWLWQVLVENHFEAYPKNRPEDAFQVPLAALAALLVLAWYVVVILVIAGFFLGWRYRFAGPQLGRREVNDVMDSIDDTAENVAENIKDGVKRNFGRRG